MGNENVNVNTASSQVQQKQPVARQQGIETGSETTESVKVSTGDEFDLESFLRSFDQGNDNVSYLFSDEAIVITANGLADHETGTFPNGGNPNAISEQDYEFSVNRNPQKKTLKTDVKIFEATLGGVTFDPGTAEKDQATGWSIEAFQDMLDLGLDFNNAHLQPTGAYHYYGVPTSLLDMSKDKHSPLIGFAADGFPVYALYGYDASSGSEIREITSSWRLRIGQRSDGPSGVYDGTYTNDFEFVSGSEDLDECNGRETVTPEYPNGTYAYFITDDFPYIPRCVYGEPDASFNSSQGLPPNAIQGRTPPPRR